MRYNKTFRIKPKNVGGFALKGAKAWGKSMGANFIKKIKIFDVNWNFDLGRRELARVALSWGKNIF